MTRLAYRSCRKRGRQAAELGLLQFRRIRIFLETIAKTSRL